MADIKKLQTASRANLKDLREIALPDLRQLLDVDGVFSAPHRGTALPESSVVNLMGATIEGGASMSLATGRPMTWITQQKGMLDLLSSYLNGRGAVEALERVITMPHFVENGGVRVDSCSSSGGYTQRVVDPNLSFPVEFAKLPDAVVERLRIGRFAERDRDKSCIMSIYVFREGFGAADLDPYKSAIISDFRSFTATRLPDWAISATAIAIDAHHPRVSKALASEGFIQSLTSTDRSNSDLSFVAIGDSPSDYALYEGLRSAQERGELDGHAKLYFVFTGDEAGLEMLGLRAARDLSKADDFIYAGALGSEHEIRIYSDATADFFRRLLE